MEKISLMQEAFKNAEKEKIFASYTLKARTLAQVEENAMKEALVKRFEDFNGRKPYKSEKAKLEDVAKENMKHKKALVNKALAKLAPKYYNDALKALYIAYCDAMTSDNIENAKRALQSYLNEDYNTYYNLKTCEAILARVGCVRGTVQERKNGLLIKARSREDFARMLMNALYQQFTKEGMHLAKDYVTSLKYALDKEAQEACAKAEKALANFA